MGSRVRLTVSLLSFEYFLSLTLSLFFFFSLPNEPFTRQWVRERHASEQCVIQTPQKWPWLGIGLCLQCRFQKCRSFSFFGPILVFPLRRVVRNHRLEQCWSDAIRWGRSSVLCVSHRELATEWLELPEYAAVCASTENVAAWSLLSSSKVPGLLIRMSRV